jgi:hypothetical protein
MSGTSVVRVGVLVVATIGCIAAMVTTHVVVANLLGPIGGVLAAVVAGMLLGCVVWVGAVVTAPRSASSANGRRSASRGSGIR